MHAVQSVSVPILPILRLRRQIKQNNRFVENMLTSSAFKNSFCLPVEEVSGVEGMKVKLSYHPVPTTISVSRLRLLLLYTQQNKCVSQVVRFFRGAL